MSAEVVTYWADGMGQQHGVLQVTLHHEGRLNAMSRPMWRQLRAVFEDVQRRSDVRCVIVQGQGQAFCAGGDISEYPDFRFDPVQLRAFHETDVWGGLAAMQACDVPIVASIAGACMGAGVEIASCCDIRLASEDARFGAPIARLGFPMAPREAQLVARAVGDLTARQMLLEAASFSARQMLERGFLSHVLAPEELAAQVQETALRIAALAPGAARLNKQTLRDLQSVHTNSAMQALVDGQSNPYGYADSHEHREGIEAFIAKRKPDFKNLT
ncbi:enoyl-CoA hydratase/isomerase family protein [Comamonas composti]|uniref:enoyl-CoA hydratase/isomerase family protein n=1 Tax=Comamonas composti TaxID=408558 RepID=UPI000404C675|nr:enoyl-CoA hydratase/isomerase family protein [Comamonas composti]